MHSTLTYSLVFIDFGCKIITFPRNKQIFCKKICFSAYNFIKMSIFADDNEDKVTIRLNKQRFMKTKHVQYQTQGTCSQLIDVTADENNIIQQVFFLGGCNGNLQGISQLVRGQHIDDVMKRLNGIRCGVKSTSCPDQLCRALEQLKNAPIEDK